MGTMHAIDRNHRPLYVAGLLVLLLAIPALAAETLTGTLAFGKVVKRTHFDGAVDGPAPGVDDGIMGQRDDVQDGRLDAGAPITG